MKTVEQPKWLQETVAGMSGSHRFSVTLEGKRFAIIKSPGRTEYINRVTGSAYSRTSYILVEKGKDYWHGLWKEVHEGRLTKRAKERLKQVLNEREAQGSAVR